MTRRASTAGKRPQTIATAIVEEMHEKMWNSPALSAPTIPQVERWLVNRIAAEIRKAVKAAVHQVDANAAEADERYRRSKAIMRGIRKAARRGEQ